MLAVPGRLSQATRPAQSRPPSCFLYPLPWADMATLPSAGTEQSSHATGVPIAKDTAWQHNVEQKGLTTKQPLRSVLVWLECRGPTCDTYCNSSFSNQTDRFAVDLLYDPGHAYLSKNQIKEKATHSTCLLCVKIEGSLF